MHLQMLKVRVLVGKSLGAERTGEGLEFEVQGLYVFAQVVLGAEVLTTSVAVQVVHCFLSIHIRLQSSKTAGFELDLRSAEVCMHFGTFYRKIH